MLRIAISGGNKRYKKIGEAVRGVVFLATPHTGANLATIIKKIGRIFRSTVIIDNLRDNEPMLIGLNSWYIQNSLDLHIKSRIFFETCSVGVALIVDESSGGIEIGGQSTVPVGADHI